MSFAALLSSNRDSIEDLINRELFAEYGGYVWLNHMNTPLVL